MRQTATALNRAWLSVVGLLTLLSGLAVVLIGTGLLAPLAAAARLEVSRPRPADRLFGAATASALGLTWVALLIAVLGVVVALLGLAWLVAQVPRTNSAKPFRLHDDTAGGLTSCAPAVLADAVEAQIATLPDVQEASAVIRGTAQQPELTVKVTATDQADVPRLLEALQTQVATDLGGALDTRLARLGVQIEIGATRSSSGEVVLEPR
ncbi:hypothetical protein [uncultured Friedmanniella sp.]|uniref:hypothetical protein n=1 Tax=uncultured Friedmanniella sp. TaxID=335381 RepID=UPI0035C9D9B6